MISEIRYYDEKLTGFNNWLQSLYLIKTILINKKFCDFSKLGLKQSLKSKSKAKNNKNHIIIKTVIRIFKEDIRNIILITLSISPTQKK